jgi:hypothetical protein
VKIHFLHNDEFFGVLSVFSDGEKIDGPFLQVILGTAEGSEVGQLG